MSSRGVVVKVLDCDHEESEFEIQSYNLVHFRTNNLGKGMKAPYYSNYNTFAMIWHKAK